MSVIISSPHFSTIYSMQVIFVDANFRIIVQLRIVTLNVHVAVE